MSNPNSLTLERLCSHPVIEVGCGDCLELMKDMKDKSVSLILTDPPYDDTTHNGGKFTHEIKFGNVDFESMDIIPLIKEFLRISLKWVLVFCPIETLGSIKKEYPKEYIRGGIWDRIINSPQISGDRPAQACEGIAILHNEGRKIWNGGGNAGIWRAWTERGMKVHPTQKPLKLIRRLLLDFSNEGDLICDPFFGSATCAHACYNTNRNFIGFELDRGYYEIGKQRIMVAQRQQRIDFEKGEVK